MDTSPRADTMSRLVIGVALIGAGLLFTAENFGLIEIREVIQLWPVVLLAVGAQQVLAEAPAGFRTLLFFEGGGEPLAQAVDRSAGGHLLLVGPEGGFAPGEVEAALAAGAHLTTLGPRILRFETAAIVAAALVQHLAGDLG